jgi:hypothetical protein
MLRILKRPVVSISASIKSRLDAQQAMQLCSLNEINYLNIQITNQGGNFLS